MARPRKASASSSSGNGATVGYEPQLWKAADALRNNMDPGEYKHVVLGLIFLKYISDAFEEQHAKLEGDRRHGADPEDPDEYRAANYTTCRLARMNLAILGIDAQIRQGDTFHNDRHPDLKADYVLANPTLNDSDWRGELLKDDKGWVCGTPPAGKANYGWVQHFVPRHGGSGNFDARTMRGPGVV